MLETIVHGAGQGGVPLLVAHGLYGSARNWGVIAKRLSDGRTVVAVDMRNHGASPRDPDHSYPALAGDLAEVIEAHGGRADLLGHSMGGKAAMVLGLTRPELLRHLIVADIAPVAYGHSQLPYIAAMQAVDLSRVVRRSDADAQLAADVADPALRAFLLQSLDLTGDAPVWRLNLPVLADQMPKIMGFPERLGQSPVAARFIRGGASDYVAPATHPAIRAHFPRAEIVEMPGRGHWLHAADPRGFEAALRAVLETRA